MAHLKIQCAGETEVRKNFRRSFSGGLNLRLVYEPKIINHHDYDRKK
jgi:hypothetical protein